MPHKLSSQCSRYAVLFSNDGGKILFIVIDDNRTSNMNHRHGLVLKPLTHPVAAWAPSSISMHLTGTNCRQSGYSRTKPRLPVSDLARPPRQQSIVHAKQAQNFPTGRCSCAKCKSIRLLSCNLHLMPFISF